MNHAPGCIGFALGHENDEGVTHYRCYRCGAEKIEFKQKPHVVSWLRRLWSRLTCRCDGVGLDDICKRCGRPGDMGVW